MRWGHEELALQGRDLAHVVAALSHRQGRRCLLIASARRREGKSTLLRVVQQHWCHVCRAPLVCLDMGQLATRLPGPYLRTDAVVLIDGPAYAEGEQSLSLALDWREVVEGALLVVLAYRSRVDQLVTAAQRLEAAGIKPLGVIWNQGAAPRAARGWPARGWQRSNS